MWKLLANDDAACSTKKRNAINPAQAHEGIAILLFRFLSLATHNVHHTPFRFHIVPNIGKTKLYHITNYNY